MKKYKIILIITTILILVTSLYFNKSKKETSHLDYYSIGFQKLNEKKFSEALKMLDKSIKLKPTWEAYLARGQVKTSLNDFYGANSDFIKSNDLNPKSESEIINRKLNRDINNKGHVVKSIQILP